MALVCNTIVAARYSSTVLEAQLYASCESGYADRTAIVVISMD